MYINFVDKMQMFRVALISFPLGSQRRCLLWNVTANSRRECKFYTIKIIILHNNELVN